MNRHCQCALRFLVLVGSIAAMMIAISSRAAQNAEPAAFAEPKPLVPGAKVVTLWPAGSPALKTLAGYDKPENFNMTRSQPQRVQAVTNINNPSIELHLAPPDKANGMAVILAAGGGNTTLNVGT